MKIVALLSGLMLSGAMMSCAGPGIAFDEHKVFQSIQVGNNGSVAVSDASILYGHKELLFGPALQNYPVEKVRIPFSHGLVSIIPEQTQIHWVTKDESSHDVTVPTRRLVRNLSVFYGFRFYFVNDHVDVYLIEKVPNPGHYLNVKYTKVYSSTP